MSKVKIMDIRYCAFNIENYYFVYRFIYCDYSDFYGYIKFVFLFVTYYKYHFEYIQRISCIQNGGTNFASQCIIYIRIEDGTFK